MDDCSARLRKLDDAAFESFVQRFTETVWRGWESTISPPSPDHSVDVRLTRGDDRELLRVKHRPANSPVGAPVVADLATIRDRREFDGVTLAATSALTGPARALATDRGVGVLDTASLCRLCRELGIEIPEPNDDYSELQEVVETYAAYWPASLAERTGELLDTIDGLAEFEHCVRVGDASTVVDFLLDGQALVKARLGETSVLVYVWTGDEFERVVGLSAYRGNQSSLADLLSDLESHIERVVETDS